MQACSAVDRALEFWIFVVAPRHFCLAAATALPEPVVVEVVADEGEEVLELPHALRAAAATTSTTRSAERRPIMPAIIPQTVADGQMARRAAENPADKHLRIHTAPTPHRGCAKAAAPQWIPAKNGVASDHLQQSDDQLADRSFPRR